MRRAYICSPLSGNISGNIENAKRYARYIFKCGMAPVIPHFYALVLNDEIPDERKLGMQAGLSLLWVCDEVWVFGDEITEGMKKEIIFAEKLKNYSLFLFVASAERNENPFADLNQIGKGRRYKVVK